MDYDEGPATAIPQRPTPSFSLCSDEEPKVEKMEVGQRFSVTAKVIYKDEHESLGRKKHTDMRFEIVGMEPTKKGYSKKVSEYGSS